MPNASPRWNWATPRNCRNPRRGKSFGSLHPNATGTANRHGTRERHMQHSETYLLFREYWWLVFVLVWAIARLARLWSRHVQAQRTLDMIKSYVDQGKE